MVKVVDAVTAGSPGSLSITVTRKVNVPTWVGLLVKVSVAAPLRWW